MAAWMIGAIKNVTDPAEFAEYQRLATPWVAEYGGKLIAGGNKIEVADGSWSLDRVVVLEFESLEQVKKFYYSPEYQAVIGRRFKSADSSAIFVEGG